MPFFLGQSAVLDLGLLYHSSVSPIYPSLSSRGSLQVGWEGMGGDLLGSLSCHHLEGSEDGPEKKGKGTRHAGHGVFFVLKMNERDEIERE